MTFLIFIFLKVAKISEKAHTLYKNKNRNIWVNISLVSTKITNALKRTMKVNVDENDKDKFVTNILNNLKITE